ncbi:unnamed protein product [Toxocara canis]|uniref:MFS_1_like domain-containing protein n=1 Tax=Toxocara canis TaxID=6265 RepID=A0A183VC26_TOXCA|nr:unnamed protein product [Toxocara canis]
MLTMGDDDLNEHYLYSKAPLWSIYTQLSFDVVMLFAAPTLLVAVVIRKAAYIIYALTRLYLIFTALRIATLSHSIYAFTWKLNNFSLYTASLNMAALVTERVSAVMFARFYEKFCDRIPLYGICLAIVQWGISSIIISLYTDGALSRFTVIAIWFCCHLFASMAIALTAVMFARCPQLRMGMAVSLRCRNAVAPSSYPPRSLNGKTLVVPLEEEGTIYFGALAKAWA